MTRKIIFISLILVSSINAQQLTPTQLDSVYNLYTFLLGINLSNALQSQIEYNPAIRKCGMSLAQQVKSNFTFFSTEQQKVLLKILQRPSLPNSLVTSNQFFRIHYTTTGTDAIGYDVNLLAQALDSVYSFEINYLGFPPPPPDGVEGGDDKYDIYVIDLGNLYGQTWSENKVGTSRWTTYIEIDNNFPWYSNAVPPKLPIDAARVTVAHEFHHSIQMGNYAPLNGNDPFNSADTYFYELTSTSMEEFVFSTVNDYYGYIDDYFNHPERAFASNNGYDLAIWNIFIKDNFGFGIIKNQWELMPTKRAIDAINTSLLEHQSSFGKELNTFGIWTYYTGYRAKTGYFSEAVNYPLINSNSFEMNTSVNLPQIKPTSNNHLLTISPNGQDTLAIILTNTDYISGIDNLTKNYNATYNLYNHNNPGSTKIGESNYFEQLSVDDVSLWLTSVILNGIVIKRDTMIYVPVASNLDYGYPNPFRYSEGSVINIPVNAPIYSKVDLYIFSTSMNLIFNKNLQVNFGKDNAPIISWNLDDVGKKLASGVYIYITKSDKEKSVGKLVIIND